MPHISYHFLTLLSKRLTSALSLKPISSAKRCPRKLRWWFFISELLACSPMDTPTEGFLKGTERNLLTQQAPVFPWLQDRPLFRLIVSLFPLIVSALSCPAWQFLWDLKVIHFVKKKKEKIGI